MIDGGREKFEIHLDKLLWKGVELKCDVVYATWNEMTSWNVNIWLVRTEYNIYEKAIHFEIREGNMHLVIL